MRRLSAEAAMPMEELEMVDASQEVEEPFPSRSEPSDVDRLEKTDAWLLPSRLEPTFSVCNAQDADVSASLEAVKDRLNSGEDPEDATTREKEVDGPMRFTSSRTLLLLLSLAQVPGC
jgi:hypothetical protein